MAKKKINKYVFSPGIAYGDNLFPNAYALINANKTFLKKEINAYLTYQSSGPLIAPASRVNAVALLIANKNFIRYEATAWISAQVLASTPPFVGYTYNADTIRNSIGSAIDGFIDDLRGGGNAETLRFSKTYRYNNVLQTASPTQEAAVYTFVRDLINNYVFPKIVYPATNGIYTQVTSGSSAESGADTSITSLTSIVTNAITLGTFTSISYNYNTVVDFQGYTFNSTKCERDAGYVIDAYLEDLRYGGNKEIRFVSSKYWIGTVAQVDGSRLPEIYAHEFARDLINNFIFTNTVFATYQQDYTNKQVITASNGEVGSSTKITAETAILTDVITNGLTALPSLVEPQGTVKFQGRYGLEDLLLITNVTDGEVIYNFSDTTRNAITEYETDEDSDFPKFLQTSDAITLVRLFYDTTGMSATDKLQIFIESTEVKVRPYDFGTDAIERMRVATPQSMLDADFEYGLQPTKWQAISTLRGYPSIYEIPGTDLQISSITTDASTNTGGVGQSLITVNTVGPHGLLVGTPVTVRGLSTSINGASRAEGSFVITSVTSSTQFGYYAKAKVGTSNGQVLSSTYSQLRQGGFYTGASIGIPSFSVVTNGVSGTFTTALNIQSGDDIIPFTGTVPGLGSPLTLTGLPLGSQVTDTEGPGGIIATTTPSVDIPIGSNSIPVSIATGIAIGQAINRGDGTAIFVNGIAGSTINFSGNTTSYFRASSQTYNAVSGNNDSSVGIGATFDISRAGGTYTSLTPNAGGSGYKIGDNILILGTSLGGATPTHDLVVRVTSVSGSVVDGVIGASGTAFPGTGSYTNVSGSTLNNGGTTAGLFDVTLLNNVYNVVLNGSDASANYTVNDRIRISGTNIGGANITNDCFITVDSVDSADRILTISTTGTAADAVVTYTTVPYTTASPGGTTAIIDVTSIGTVYSITLVNAGIGYSNGETLTVSGVNVGGTTPTNDLIITIVTTGGIGEISSVSVAGTAINTSTFSAISGTDLVGAGALFNVSYSSGIYTVTVATGGTDYGPGQQILIVGTALGGVTPANDLTITISSVGVSNSISTISSSGTAASAAASYTGVSGTNITQAGSSATFNITRSGGSYTIAGIDIGGTNYMIGNRIIILGSSLGGVSPTNDAVLRVTAVNIGAITTIVVDSGTTAAASNIDFLSTVTVTEAASAPIASGSTATFGAIATIGVSFTTAHGLVPGSSFITTIQSTGANHELAAGPFYVTEIPSLTSIQYQARAVGTVDISTTLVGIIYPRPDSFFIHRPFDGGVQLGTGGPQHGAQAVRQSKKYIRYQSGKGIMYTTGALFAPSYDILNISAAGTSIGSTITITTDDVAHGLQVGGVIKLIGIDTYGYNAEYSVTDIVSENIFQVTAQDTLGSASPTLGQQPQASMLHWHGASVRAGAFDDQNGIFWQYDGQYLSVVQRSSTFQIAGTISVNTNSNSITGSSTRFVDQLKAGDKIVIRGMTHVVANVSSQTSMTVTPDYRGVNNISGTKCCLIFDKISTQDDFNLDTLDSNGPSGYDIDISKMQMIGIQYSWYGAGFIDFMVRGSDGNFIFAHRMRNSNVNTEAFMRTGNLPVRYEVTNESANARLAESMSIDQTFISLDDTKFFPEFGTVYIDNEIITYSGKSGNRLTGCTRASTLINFTAGSQRSYTAGSAATHTSKTGVVLISNTISPIISHWGSAMITDGSFDEDRGYIFSYAATGVSVTTSKQTVFLIRLAPSVSNAVIGDLGDRELLNRAQLLLQTIEITSDTGTAGIVVEGVLNPQNYPIDPALVTWSALSGSAQGGQPSFTQVAAGGGITWTAGGGTTASATTQASMTGTIVARSAGYFGSSRSMQSGATFFFIRTSDYNTYLSQGLTTGLPISGTGIPSNTVITGIFFYGSIGGISYNYVVMNNAANANVIGDNNVTVTQTFKTATTSSLYFQQASWESSTARAGTEVNDANFPAGTFVSSASLQNFFSTNYYNVSFNRSSINIVALIPGTTAITFKFGAPNFALPGETVFSFIASPGTNSALELVKLKELTNTTLGGRGTYPNGPDVLAINVYKAAGTAVNSNIILRWGEAQA